MLSVTQEARIGSYLGVPIMLQDGSMFGTLCSVDPEPYNFTTDEVEAISRLARFFAYAIDLERLAVRDALTGLYNRHVLKSMLAHEVERATRTGEEVVIIYIDLDGFKLVNDQVGHEAGDEVLRTTAARLLAAVRKGDVVARVGGDEFVIALGRGADLAMAEAVEERIQTTCSTPFLFGELSLVVAPSVGIARFPRDADTAEALVAAADQAMYRAKRKRKGGDPVKAR